MRYKSYVTIENDNGKIIEEGLDDIIDRYGYLIIDKEMLARRIIDENDITDMDECDIMALVDDELNEIGSWEVTDMILEMRGEE